MNAGDLQRESKLLAQLREATSAFDGANLRYMVVGGVAVNAHGVLRATHDLDIMVLSDDSDALHASLLNLGYTCIDRRDDLAHYRRTDGARLDVLYARREISHELLQRPVNATYSDQTIPIVDAEGLIGLKVQAFNDDARRIRDLDDIIQLVRCNRTTLDMSRVTSYFELFGRRALLDDILRAIDGPGPSKSA